MMQNRITTGFSTIVAVTAASGAAAGFFTLRIRGSFDVDTDGVIDFSFNFSAVPTVGTVIAGSNVMLWPVGTDVGDTQIGDWT
jgi:hypothetical protein